MLEMLFESSSIRILEVKLANILWFLASNGLQIVEDAILILETQCMEKGFLHFLTASYY